MKGGQDSRLDEQGSMAAGICRMIGIRFLTSQRKSHLSFITTMAVIGVTIGVAALLIITAISSGFLDEFKKKVLGVNAHVIVLKVGETFEEYRDVVKTARREKGVIAAAPFIITEMMLVKDKAISGILIKGIDPGFAKKILDLPHHMQKGTLSSLELNPSEVATPLQKDEIDIGGILDEESGEAKPRSKTGEETASADERLTGMIVGATLAENIGARLGDRVKVISPVSGLDTSYLEGKFDTSVSAQFQIAGIFYSGFDEYDSRLVYVNLYQAQKLFGYGDSVTGVEMKVADVDRAKEIAASLEEKLSGGLYRIIDWEELNRPLFTALFVQKIALTVVLMLSVLMASLNIISMLILLIMSKKKDISILKSMGATKRQIASIFMTIGVVVGALGLVIGSGLGAGICHLLTTYGWRLDPKVYLIDHLPLSLSLSDYLICVGVTFAICVAFTIIPSLKAASLSPVEGIKYE